VTLKARVLEAMYADEEVHTVVCRNLRRVLGVPGTNRPPESQPTAMRAALGNTEPHIDEAPLWRSKLEQHRRENPGAEVLLSIRRPLGDPNDPGFFYLEIVRRTDYGRKMLAQVGRFADVALVERFAQAIEPVRVKQ